MKICVFCGSSMGSSSVYRDAAKDVGDFLARNNYDLVYGGSNVGLMKVVADAMLEANKEVIGVMPLNLVQKEVAHQSLTEMIIVDTMAERKEKMVELSDGFVALPGGFGTIDELSEILTFNQLRISDKPLGILNTNDYFDLFLKFSDHAVKEGFVRKEHRENMIISDNIEELLTKMNAYQPLSMGKWLKDIRVESDN